MLSFQWKSQSTLYKKALGGDRRAALDLVKQLTPKAHAVAWRILGNAQDAEDVLQEAFVRLFKSDRFEGNSSLDTYFYTIITRLCFDFLKAHKRHQFEQLEDTADDEDVAADVALEVSQDGSLMQQAIQQLNPRQRLAISLWAYKDSSVEEIAQLLDIDKNAAHQLLHRAKLNLKKIWELNHHVG